MIFHDPLALLLIVPLLVTTAARQRQRTKAVTFPGETLFQGLPTTPRQRLARLLPFMQALALVLAVIALARPQMTVRETSITSRGVDLAMAIDLSTSMLAVDRETDQRPRLDIAREVARAFISRRTGDRIGLVAFAARSYPVAPLTLDHNWLIDALANLHVGGIEDGTALGDGLLAALNRLRESPAASRAAILITDGRSNTGATPPVVAARVARTMGIRVHTVGIGGQGTALFPIEDPLGGTIYRRIRADLDEQTLREIAATTGGRYFRAADKTALQEAFGEIDRLEKRPIEEKVNNSFIELQPAFLLPAFGLLLASALLDSTWLRRVP